MRRRLLTIAIFLLAGAVVNVAVAWGLMHLQRQSFYVSYTFDEAQITSFARRSVTETADLSVFDAMGFGGLGWTELHCAVGEQRQLVVVITAFVAGWPMDALRCYRVNRNAKWDGISPPAFTGARPFPKTPILLGFLINTLFYAAILWLLIPGPFALRRLVRVRRGLCPKCAYPMGESAVCSECGCKLPRPLRPAT